MKDMNISNDNVKIEDTNIEEVKNIDGKIAGVEVKALSRKEMKQLRAANYDPAFWSKEDIDNREKSIDMFDFILDAFYADVEISYIDGLALAKATYERTYGREEARKN